VYFPNPSL